MAEVHLLSLRRYCWRNQISKHSYTCICIPYLQNIHVSQREERGLPQHPELWGIEADEQQVKGLVLPPAGYHSLFLRLDSGNIQHNIATGRHALQYSSLKGDIYNWMTWSVWGPIEQNCGSGFIIYSSNNRAHCFPSGFSAVLASNFEFLEKEAQGDPKRSKTHSLKCQAKLAHNRPKASNEA